MLLPYLEMENAIALYDFKLKLYADCNQAIVRLSVATYQCPSDTAAGRLIATSSGAYHFSRSNIAVNYGTEGMCTSCTFSNSSNAAKARTNGAFQIDLSRRFEDFTDGTSNTVAASEVLSGKRDGSGGAADMDYRGAWALPIHGGNYEHYDTPNTSIGDYMWTNTCSSDEPDMPCGPSQGTNLSQQHIAARSHHPGGVNVVFVDGHCNFVPDVVDLAVWRAIGARDDGSTLGVGAY
jgi:prepilin-type processing-associated H-X9-DG protein